MPVLEELRRGHTVTLLTGADDVELARGLGYDAYAVAPEIESVEFNDWTERSAQSTADLGAGDVGTSQVRSC